MKSSTATTLGICLLTAMATACSGSASPEYAADQMAAPPVEGESGAPTLEPTAAPDYNPSGVLVFSGSDSGLAVYNSNGQIVETINLPEAADLNPENLCLAGSGVSGVSAAQLVYFSHQSDAGLVMSANEETRQLRQVDSLIALACAPGQAALAFSEIRIDDDTPRSFLYAGGVDEMDALEPLLEWEDAATQTALMPVAVKAIGANPKLVLYTLNAWGIGGHDLVFPITRGLFQYELTAGTKHTLLEEDRLFQGISADLRLAASLDFQPNPDGRHAIRVTDLESGWIAEFFLKANSQRGAGYAVFSPDNQHMAWMEASGSFDSDPADFLAVVRVGDLAGGDTEIELDNLAAAQALKVDRVDFLKPVGWLDGQSLLIEASAADWAQTYLLRLNLYDRSTSQFCAGRFMGFVYP